MMNRYLTVVLFSLLFYNAKADHLSGSELIYEYLGPGQSPNTQRFQFTYRLFRSCNSTSPTLDFETVTLGIYHSNNRSLFTELKLAYQGTTNISRNTALLRCFTGTIAACYGVGIFMGTVELPVTTDGFTASWLRCCRPTDIINLPGGEIGVNPVATIPGSNIIGTGHNSSAIFLTNDTALVCAGKNFRMDFSASDKDGDSISYRFTAGYNWITQFAYNPPPLTQLNYTQLSYAGGYSATNPTGTSPTINPVTGEIKGVAPSRPGRYLFCIMAEEWRGGTKINEHIKEIPVIVGNCDFIEASLPQKIINCNSNQVFFENGSASSGITSYRWTFDTLHPAGNSSSLPTLTYQYQDTGTYIAKLVVTGSNGCRDSVTAQVLIYPGLKAGFSITGSCIRYPYTFNDTSSTKGTAITKWNWDLGEPGIPGNNNTSQFPTFLYASPGNKNIKLVVESGKGCKDSTNLQFNVKDKPPLKLSFHDTTICRTDTLQLQELSAHSQYQWTPQLSISGATTATPKVYPGSPAKYYVSVTANNCENLDSVTITVLPKNTVYAGKDTITCKGDPVYLAATTGATVMVWTGDATIQNAGNASTKALPKQTVQYIITANPGRCATKDTLQVKVVDYPLAMLQADTVICFGVKFLLRGQVQGSSFSWTPANNLSDGSILTPYAAPSKTMQYILTASDTLGCPKPFSDTIRVTVIPAFNVWAGNDTVAVAGQSLQLSAITSDPVVQRFTWSPTMGLNDPTSANPLVALPAGIDSIRYKVTANNGNCYAEDYVTVKLYAGGSDFYVPTGFTPNGDGVNDVFKAHSAGIGHLDFIRVFNRFGEMIFSSNNLNRGWDGSYKGLPQQQGTYIFWVRGISFNGTIVERKGSVVLLR